MKSVLHIGHDAANHSKEGLRKGFIGAGFTEYNFINWQNLRLDVGIIGTQTRILRAAQSLNPDLIFCHLQSSEIFDEETVMELSKCGFTVNYTFDQRDNEKTQWMYELAPYFGLTLFASADDSKEARRLGIKNAEFIHSSCDTDLYRPMIVSVEEKERYPEIVFIGNNYQNTNLNFENAEERERMVHFMKTEFGDRFGVFGMNWKEESRIINPQEEVIIYNSAKIVVCHNNFNRIGYCSDRQWRSMSCGAFTVLNSYQGLKSDFDGDIPEWKSFGELANQCRYFLNDNTGRKFWSQHQHTQFLKRHTWKHRIEEIKQMINELNTTK